MCVCCYVSLCVTRMNGFGFDAMYGYVHPPPSYTLRLPCMLWGTLTRTLALADRCTDVPAVDLCALSAPTAHNLVVS